MEVGSSVQAQGLLRSEPREEWWPRSWAPAIALPPSLAPLWSPVQRQIQEEPLDSLSSTVRWQAMETLTQLRCPQPSPRPPALSSLLWAPSVSPEACPWCPPGPVTFPPASPEALPFPSSPPHCAQARPKPPARRPPPSPAALASCLPPRGPSLTPRLVFCLSPTPQSHPARAGCARKVRAGQHMREECVLPALCAGHAGERRGQGGGHTGEPSGLSVSFERGAFRNSQRGEKGHSRRQIGLFTLLLKLPDLGQCTSPLLARVGP